MNSTQKKRLGLIAGGLIICGAAAALVFNAFEENLVFFFSPSQVAAHEAPEGRAFRIGGFVQEGSVQRHGSLRGDGYGSYRSRDIQGQPARFV